MERVGGAGRPVLLDEPDNFLDVPAKRALEQQLRATQKTVLVISHDRALLSAACDAIVTLEGKVMVSGYANELYDSRLAGWARHTFDVPNNAAGGKSKRRMTEVLWCSWPA